MIPVNTQACNATYDENSGKNMSEKKDEYPWNSRAQKPKEQNISEIMQKSRTDDPCSTARVDLRDLLVQRTMARHGFTHEQALAVILAFGG